MSVFPIGFDSDRWVRVPTDWAGEPWSGAEEWAEWIAAELTDGRPDSARWRPVLQHEAATIAAIPAEHVSARFWFFPIDGDPRGWVDLYAQLRDGDEADASALLPELAGTLIDPATDVLEYPGFSSAVRRLALLPLGEAALGEGRSGILAQAEWSAVAGDWVLYLISIDSDPRELTLRLDDIDTLLAGVDPSTLAELPEARR